MNISILTNFDNISKYNISSLLKHTTVLRPCIVTVRYYRFGVYVYTEYKLQVTIYVQNRLLLTSKEMVERLKLPFQTFLLYIYIYITLWRVYVNILRLLSQVLQRTT